MTPDDLDRLEALVRESQKTFDPEAGFKLAVLTVGSLPDLIALARKGLAQPSTSIEPEDLQRLEQLYYHAPKGMRCYVISDPAQAEKMRDDDYHETQFRVAVADAFPDLIALARVGLQHQAQASWTCTCGVENRGQYCYQCGRMG